MGQQNKRAGGGVVSVSKQDIDENGGNRVVMRGLLPTHLHNYYSRYDSIVMMMTMIVVFKGE